MVEPSNYSSADVYIDDEEKTVDTKVKNRIVALREDVDEWAKELFTKEKFGEIDHQTAVSIWGDRVRTYLLAVEPLCWNTGLENSQEVYLNEKLGVVEVHPPQEWVEATSGRQRRNGDVEVLEDGAIEPKKRVISGLKDVIERESVSASWTIQIRDRNGGRGQRRVEETVTQTAPINKTTLRNAIRVADEFLQRNGIGVDFGVQDYRSTEPL